MQKKKLLENTGFQGVLLVRMAGLEPARPYEHQHLKLASLPIPAHPHLAWTIISDFLILSTSKYKKV